MDIKFNILKEELQYKSIEEFDEFGNVEGQFEFVIGDIRFGYVDDEIPFSNELLISWFRILNRVLVKLIENSKYVTFYIPGTNKWLELEVQEDFIRIRELKTIGKDIEFLITSEKYVDLFENSGKMEKIKKGKFTKYILESTSLFIECISKINVNLLSSKTMKELIKLYIKANNDNKE